MQLGAEVNQEAEKEVEGFYLLWNFLEASLLYLSIPFLFSTAVCLMAFGLLKFFRHSSFDTFSPAGAGLLASYLSSSGGSFSVIPPLIFLALSSVLIGGFHFDQERLKKSILEYKIFFVVFSIVFVVCSNYFSRAYRP